MKHASYGKWFLAGLLVCILTLIPGRTSSAASPVMQIQVKDGFTTQVIGFYYGRTPSGYQGFYADSPSVLVHPRAKKVRFYVKNSNGVCSGVTFQNSSIVPGKELQSNMMNFTAYGRRRAYVLTVRKAADPKILSLKLAVSDGKKVFAPKGKKFVEIKAKTFSEINSETSIRIQNEKGQVVFYKKYKPGKSRTYTCRWKGRTSGENDLGVPKNTYVPSGKYKVSVITAVSQKRYKKTDVKYRWLRIESNRKTGEERTFS